MQLKSVFENTSKREKIQENGKSQKCSFGQSHTLQNQHQKNQQDPAKKKQNTKSQTQECV
jgi:ribosomal protein L35